MTYQILTVVYNWCVNQHDVANTQLRDTGESKVSMEYLEALAELATALKKVMKFN